MSGDNNERMRMPGSAEFLRVLDACEQTSDALLLALDSGTPAPTALAVLRGEQIEHLAAILPGESCVRDLEKLEAVLNVGQQVCLKALAEKSSATRHLASLQSALQVARQLAATRTPRQSGVDCRG